MRKITAIVPIYNVEQYLKKCLDSLLAQTFPFYEIILVDDGSKDSSGKIAEEYAEKFGMIKVIHQENQGLSAARNTGLNSLTGDYVMFVDSDDYISLDMNEKLMNLLDAHNADVARGGVWYEYETGSKYSPYPNNVTFTWNTEEAMIELASQKYLNMSAWGWIFKSDLIKSRKIRFPVGVTSEDYYFTCQVIAAASKVVYTSEPFYHYLQRSGSISRGRFVDHAPLAAAKYQLEFYEKQFPHIVYAAKTACVFADIGVYNLYLIRVGTCPKILSKQLRKEAREYLVSVVRNTHITVKKKIQVILFAFNFPGYNFILKKAKNSDLKKQGET